MSRIAVIILDMAVYLTFPKSEYRKIDVSNMVIYMHINCMNTIVDGSRKEKF